MPLTSPHLFFFNLGYQEYLNKPYFPILYVTND